MVADDAPAPLVPDAAGARFGAGGPTRRAWLAMSSAALLGAAGGAEELTVFTFGDSVLDCGHYNPEGLDPGQLLLRNDDTRFPEFRGRDLRSRGPCRLVHRAVDGSTVDDLPAQARDPRVTARRETPGRAVALVSVGGNDLLRGLAADTGSGLARFREQLEAFLDALPVRPVLLANVYDPTFGDDRRNFLGVEARVARANHRRMNQLLGELAARHGRLADLHGHFLQGEPTWFTHVIEPSLTGASEIRRVFLTLM